MATVFAKDARHIAMIMEMGFKKAMFRYYHSF